ncbi:hypothetical protein C8J57DRAFT_1248955 [Mycena rebaudengoi]|nr:hypothetical protein C8J57DRAFT_1248955 [Mycena rebaudengoi]
MGIRDAGREGERKGEARRRKDMRAEKRGDRQKDGQGMEGWRIGEEQPYRGNGDGSAPCAILSAAGVLYLSDLLQHLPRVPHTRGPIQNFSTLPDRLALPSSGAADKHKQDVCGGHARIGHAVRGVREGRAQSRRREVQHATRGARRGVPEVRGRVDGEVRQRGGGAWRARVETLRRRRGAVDVSGIGQECLGYASSEDTEPIRAGPNSVD